MYSTLDDLLKFYSYVRSGKVLETKHNCVFTQPSANLDGSDRGFELFSIYLPGKSEIFLFLNNTGKRENLRQLFSGLEELAGKP